MDSVRAKKLHNKLKGNPVGGWVVGSYIDHGKSAIVVEAARGDVVGALKIFDPELVEKFGKDTQLARIERERALIGVQHPHLVKIYDGGECGETGQLFVVMELIKARNISQVLEKIPPAQIGQIVAQVASAAQFLWEERQTTHRDIKPSNVALSDDYLHATLLDLGVQKPLKTEDVTELTDEERKPFVGTLRYASPEYLLSEVDEAQEGWKAVTFYQLGALLHDLIMKRPLFREFTEPYARLVKAVLEERPSIHSTEVDDRLVRLAECCLVKKAKPRLSLVGWADFSNLQATQSEPTEEMLRQQLAKASQLAQEQLAEDNETVADDSKWLTEAAKELRSALRNSCRKDALVPRHSATEVAAEANDTAGFRLHFSPAKELGLKCHLFFIVRLSDRDTASLVAEISVVAGAAVSAPTNAFELSTDAVWRKVWSGAWDVESARTTVFKHVLQMLLKATQIGPGDCKSADHVYFALGGKAGTA